MKQIIILLAYFNVFLALTSCHDQKNFYVLNKPEDLPLVCIGEEVVMHRKVKGEYEISVWINGDCLPCILEMANWHTIYYRFALPYNIAMNFYVYSQYDYSLFEETMQNTLFSSLPVYYDKNNEFLKTNNLKMGEDDCFFTKGDTIILKGNIVRDRKVYREFEQKLKGLEMVYDVSFFGFK